MQSLIIMQGAPGSGKSYVASALFWYNLNKKNKTIVASTDSYFYNDKGEYKFDPSKLGEFHKRNLEFAIDMLKQRFTVIVDNTNSKAWECRPYVKFAVDNNIPVQFIRVEGYFENSHGVPKEKVEEIRGRMQNLTLDSVYGEKEVN